MKAIETRGQNEILLHIGGGGDFVVGVGDWCNEKSDQGEPIPYPDPFHFPDQYEYEQTCLTVGLLDPT